MTTTISGGLVRSDRSQADAPVLETGRGLRDRLARLVGAASSAEDGPRPAPLAPDEALEVRPRWDSRFTPEGLLRHVLDNPGLAWRVPGTSDYALGGWWQRRREIGLVVEVMGGSRREPLVAALLEAMGAAGAALAILSPEEEERALGFYRARGWDSLEEVLIYRRDPAPVPAVTGVLTYALLSDDLMHGLMTVEEAAFPWMWRYGEDFFAEADAAPNRRLRLGLAGGAVAGYYIVSRHHDFGHLDRLAVHPACQGRGFGAMLLAQALAEMTAMGCRTAGLSTQRDNRPSQRLYESFGFRRTGSYSIHGKWLNGSGPGRMMP